ncbi:MAG: bifunctional 4-hydroxy-2-oxoglutarate aldolase/2-dehydro-3-deoxy-phosphogluconate aldolase [Candidatus Bipolaricaulota bacterium]
MLSKQQDNALERMLAERIVAVVRLADPNRGVDVARALVKGGVTLIEIAFTTPDAVNVIESVQKAVPEAMVGAGTVITEADVAALQRVRPAFAVAPVLDANVVRAAQQAGILFSPGAYTPTEVLAAWRLGAPIVKVFPAARLGPKYLADLKAPMPFLRLMPTGGVDDTTIGEFLRCGADGVGAGGAPPALGCVVGGGPPGRGRRGVAGRYQGDRARRI